MKEPFYKNIEKLTLSNTNYRTVLYTSKNQQIVLMCLQPLDFIHMEVHKDHDQYIRIEEGIGKAIINNKEYELDNGVAILIPAGSQHKIINSSPINNLK